MLLFIIIIAIILYYYHHCLQEHFWYHFRKNLGKSKFYEDKLNPNIYTKINLSEKDKNELEILYKNYLNGVIVNKKIINYFLSSMPYSQIFYLKTNSIYYGAVMNSIIKIKYKNKDYFSNFVDYAIINVNKRDKGIFKELMSYVSNYTNEMNAKYIIFKIDKKPIPSFYDYQLISNYYYMNLLPSSKNNPININTTVHYSYNPSINYQSNFTLIGELNESILCSNQFRITLQSNKTVMNFKINSPDNIELLYIFYPKKQDIKNIIEYLQNNYSFKLLITDDIGNNSHLIQTYDKLFKNAYPVYHYIIGLTEKLDKEKYYYYY
jgi:hypothetical protein